MDFGKNRVQYNDFYWQYFRYEKFDTYFYVGGKELAINTGRIAFKKIDELEKFFEYNLDKRIIFIVYNKLSDFRQSNIGLVGEANQYNIGGVTHVVKNKVFIYFEGDQRKMEQQINAAISTVMINEMIYGSNLTSKMANSTLLAIPEWFTQGLISYMANNWDAEIENKIKDGILSGKYEKFNRLTGIDAVYAGHSIWNYIAETYGKSVIPNILYLTRVSKNIESGFTYVLGTDLKNLSFEWFNYYDSKFYESDKTRITPSDTGLLKRPRKMRVYSQAKTSPDGKYIAYTTNELGQYKIWLYNTETKKTKKIFKKDHKLDQTTDYSFPLITWHPSGEILCFINEYKGKLLRTFYTVATKEYELREMLYFEKILDLSYSHDGMKLIFSGVQKGQSDLYVHNIASNTNEQLTNDLTDDLHPRFINQSKQIIFESNRINDTLTAKVDSGRLFTANNDIFIYDYQTKSPVLTRITNTPAFNETLPFEIKNNLYSYLSDENGIKNRFLANYDSTISYIDTTTHYRFFTNTRSITNYSRNILEQDINPKQNKITETILHKGKYRIYNEDIDINKNKKATKNTNTEYRKNLIDRLIKKTIADSLKTIKDTIKPKIDSTLLIKPKIDTALFDTTNINIFNYIFEKEKKSSISISSLNDSLAKFKPNTKKEFMVPNQLVYFTSFYTNYIVNQIDFGFLNSSYQAYTGGAVYFNPGFNVLFKLGTHDLFEDYRITGGVRLAGNFDSNEFLLSIENLKKRLDKQLIFHRQSYKTASQFSLSKVHTHELMYILKYPFSQVSALKGTVSARNDQNTILSTDYFNLKEKTTYKSWGGLKLEYIFDNTRSLGLNLYTGGRFKIFGESYFRVDQSKSDLYVVGADFRYYIKIHRNFIWANRIAASTSFGNSKLIYYLGSTDNWINLSSKVSTFDYSVAVDRTQNYQYQALATNMRGFTQNIRNGASFAVLNSELRFPVVKYFANRPINSDFLANLQIIGFTDVGSAWNGSSPYAKENAYNKEVIENGPVTVTIEKDRSPFVVGYGFGLRSKLLGYFVRADWSWGIENNQQLPKIFYLSLSLDF